jgi:WD40 repeat protein
MSEEGLKLPPNATLSSSSAWSLQTGQASIPLSSATANRSNAKCIVVGRQAKAVDIRVEHGSISRRHAVLYFLKNEEERCVLEDLGSKKGILVNGVLVAKGSQKDLNAGDEIIFGNARERVFHVVVSSGSTKDAAASSTAEAAKEDTTNAEESEIEQTIDKHRLPVRERMSLAAESERRHRVTCMALDTAGNRLVVGTTDGSLRFYDFGGMDRVQRGPFKMIQVEEGQKVSDVCFSNTGDRMIVGTGGSQPCVLDRDGGEM